ncbi:MAG TPA: peroxiredoxin [Planctomycetota bacterium]|jgi:thioredoxin-dependent peroxiredoxin|nr:peroxiredoxin [Planctomycetota bacterium]
MTSVILMLALLQDKAVDLKVGDAAPKFEALDDSGKTWKSEDHVGKKAIVLYFYPASFTGGCTAQAKAFQADMKKFADQNVEVVGVSGDTVRGQEAFKKYFKLDFTLLSDEKGDAAAKLYGVPLKPGGTVKQKIGDTVEEFTRGVSMDRWTFVIDKTGKIAYVNRKVNPSRDSASVLEVLEKLK